VAVLAAGLAWLALAGAAGAQEEAPPAPPAPGAERLRLDFNDVELAVVIDTIARVTGKNFIYDDRVRGRVTIVSPTEVSVDQAYAVFESVLQVKGFTTVEGPGGAIKVIPIREAKESSIETIRGRTPESDRFITRLIPLSFIDAEAIANTLKPLVSKDASMVAYPPTNTVILTDSATNIRRILDILETIDVETYKEELAVIQLRHADAATLASQLSEIYGVQVGAAAVPRARPRTRSRTAITQPVVAPEAGLSQVRVVTDERTNSLIVLASRGDLENIRALIGRLDVPVTGGGRIHVYYLRNADAEELAETLNALISGQPVAPQTGAGLGAQAAAGGAQALRATVSELAEGITVTADPGTNSLIIQASQEGFATLSQVIAQLDIPRPQVLVEALIMEVDITDNQELGFRGILTVVEGDTRYRILSAPDTPELGNVDLDGDGTIGPGEVVAPVIRDVLDNAFFGSFSRVAGDTVISAAIRAAANDSSINIISAPHILTTDNEEAEIKIGDNIPIITSRVQAPLTGQQQQVDPFQTSVNVERQDIGVTLRVTPQISEGDNVRLDIFQEITDTNPAIQGTVGNVNEVGPALSTRKVENTVVVADGETVVIGGLISDDFEDSVTKVPWLGDIPFLGWAFKSTKRNLRKTNLLVFLTPHISREVADLEEDTIRKREEFWDRSQESLDLSKEEQDEAERRRAEAEAAGIDFAGYEGRNPVRGRLIEHAERYPLERMAEIERERAEAESEAAARRAAPPARYLVLAGVFRAEAEAARTLTSLVDAGYDGTLVSGGDSGGLLYEVRLGPFEELAEAQRAVEAARSAFGLEPRIVIEEVEP
jgi:general secretion pathway protein D